MLVYFILSKVFMVLVLVNYNNRGALRLNLHTLKNTVFRPKKKEKYLDLCI